MKAWETDHQERIKSKSLSLSESSSKIHEIPNVQQYPKQFTKQFIALQL